VKSEDQKINSKGPALWEKAKTIIPGGGQLLSKRSERFLPGLWPAYYAKAKGCDVWDLDGNHYYDFAQMGVGSCVLGYAFDPVDDAVISAIRKGSMSSLNCPEEIELAEKLISLHPWAEMVRFARTGGEACAVAVRIARAATGRSKIAFCGYHGWHDWYLSANIGDNSSLDGQLLPGLEPKGIPRELRETALAFNYNKLDELESLVRTYRDSIGVIIMEPRRDSSPEPGFLQGIRAIASRIGAVLIFDEITSGFRMNVGGFHLTIGVEPDMAIFGKAMGNGFAVAAIIGRRNIMEHAQDTFISSTFWTERIGPVAALETLKIMDEKNVPEYLVNYGEMINRGWQELSNRYGISIKIAGIPPLTHLTFDVEDPLAVQTLYAQEMLSQGFLLGSSVYTTFAYTYEIIDAFINASDKAFAVIRRALHDGDIRRFLHGDVIQTGFRRLS